MLFSMYHDTRGGKGERMMRLLLTRMETVVSEDWDSESTIERRGGSRGCNSTTGNLQLLDEKLGRENKRRADNACCSIRIATREG